jgi:AraC-like DNA-binding protein
VEHVKDGFLVSFASISNASCCAMEIQSQLKTLSEKSGVKLQTQIGLSAGVPVTEDDAFFGDTIQQAKRLCEIATGNQILISSSLKEYLRDDNLKQLNEQASFRLIKTTEEDFLEQLILVSGNLWDNPEFTVELFNTKMGLSKSQMYRKTISLTGLSPSDFIKEYRLKRSLRLLVDTQRNISEIAYDTGFNSPSYFSKCFQKRYSISPSDFLGSRTRV